MTRVEFMNELRALLWDLSVEEREEALQYYNDYFDDAGAENEADNKKKNWKVKFYDFPIILVCCFYIS